jgi:hypothetical protein
MMRWKKLALVAALSALATLISTSTQGRDVSGQVFIVTKAHESVKLGLVTISVYPRDAVQSVIESVDAELKPDRDKITDLENRMEKTYDAVTAFHDQLWQQATGSSYSKQRFSAATRASQLKSDIYLLKISLTGRLNFLLGSYPYFQNLNGHHRPVATSKSDADGKFSISIPDQGEFAIAAHASRQTLKSTENYFWLVPATDHVDLSNDNLTSATTGASLLRVVGDDDEANPTLTTDAIRRQFAEIRNKYSDIFPQGFATAADTPTPPPQFITLTRDVSIQVRYGTAVLPAGTHLELISSDSSEVHVRYMNTEQVIPISAVDVR